jgi:hypothetical protein
VLALLRIAGSKWCRQWSLAWHFLKSFLSALTSSCSNVVCTKHWPNFLDFLKTESIRLTSALPMNPPQAEIQYNIRDKTKALKTAFRQSILKPFLRSDLSKKDRWLHCFMIFATCSENDKVGLSVTPKSLATRTCSIPSRTGGEMWIDGLGLWNTNSFVLTALIVNLFSFAHCLIARNSSVIGVSVDSGTRRVRSSANLTSLLSLEIEKRVGPSADSWNDSLIDWEWWWLISVTGKYLCAITEVTSYSPHYWGGQGSESKLVE